MPKFGGLFNIMINHVNLCSGPVTVQNAVAEIVLAK